MGERIRKEGRLGFCFGQQRVLIQRESGALKKKKETDDDNGEQTRMPLITKVIE